MSNASHWESVYATKRPDEVSWYAAHLQRSLRLIESTNPDRYASVIDVGGGESTLVDDLLERGYRNVAVLDLSSTALEVARCRLGAAGSIPRWLHGDVTSFPFRDDEFDVWHDRAVFHFLTSADERGRYVAQVRRSVRPGGAVIVATFGPDGPTQCSGLAVRRYDADGLHGEFGEGFRLYDHQVELHHTPMGTVQQFVYCLCRLEKHSSL